MAYGPNYNKVLLLTAALSFSVALSGFGFEILKSKLRKYYVDRNTIDLTLHFMVLVCMRGTMCESGPELSFDGFL